MSPSANQIPTPDVTPTEFAASLDTAGDCWTWTGKRNASGYGVAKWLGKWVGTHRIAWMIANAATIPQGMFICHHCDNPPCCRPDHLYLGTPAQNTQDAYDRGRQPARRKRTGSAYEQACMDAVPLRPSVAAAQVGLTTRELARVAAEGRVEFFTLPGGQRRYIAASVRTLAESRVSA